ncbi:MAG: YbaN family protein [bacterium]
MEKRTDGEMKISNNIFVRWIFIVSGVLLTAIGILGMFVPLLPTTIFLILAAWCFARSSETFYRLLHTNKLFGKYLSNYRSGKGMTIGSKVLSLAVLWLGIGYSAIFATELIYVRILLLAIGAGVTWHLLAIKTYREENK